MEKTFWIGIILIILFSIPLDVMVSIQKVNAVYYNYAPLGDKEDLIFKILTAVFLGVISFIFTYIISFVVFYLYKRKTHYSSTISLINSLLFSAVIFSTILAFGHIHSEFGFCMHQGFLWIHSYVILIQIAISIVLSFLIIEKKFPDENKYTLATLLLLVFVTSSSVYPISLVLSLFIQHAL